MKILSRRTAMFLETHGLNWSPLSPLRMLSLPFVWFFQVSPWTSDISFEHRDDRMWKGALKRHGLICHPSDKTNFRLGNDSRQYAHGTESLEGLPLLCQSFSHADEQHHFFYGSHWKKSFVWCSPLMWFRIDHQNTSLSIISFHR